LISIKEVVMTKITGRVVEGAGHGAGRRGPKSLPSILRKRVMGISLSPYHRYALQRMKMDGESLSGTICRLIETRAAQVGLREDEFLQREDKEEYARGRITMSSHSRKKRLREA
jgi:hypothetical protein